MDRKTLRAEWLKESHHSDLNSIVRCDLTVISYINYLEDMIMDCSFLEFDDETFVNAKKLIDKAENNGWSFNYNKCKWCKDGWSDKTLLELKQILT